MGFLSRVYLVLYNMVLVCGWFNILMHTCWCGYRAYLSNSLAPFSKLYPAVEWYLLIFQTAAVMEILHAAVGLVKSNPVLTAFQVFSRLFITWAIAYSVKQVQSHISISMCLFAWSVTEVIRYSYYAFSLYNCTPYFLTWCRYTFFIVLYPLGVTGEVWSVLYSMPYASSLFRMALPNKYNFSFYFPYFLIVFVAMYFPSKSGLNFYGTLFQLFFFSFPSTLSSHVWPTQKAAQAYPYP